MTTRLLTSFAALLVALLAYRFLTKPGAPLSLLAMDAEDAIKSSKFADEGVLQSVKKIEDVATYDIPALPSQKTAWAMAWLHLVVFNSWKSIYYHASKFPENSSDFENYRAYALLSVQYLVEHHDAEESDLFPVIDKKIPGSMTKNIEQHEAFLDGLVKLEEYLKKVKPSSFTADSLRSQLNTLIPPIMQHLAEELDSLESSYLLNTGKFTQEELQVLNTATHKAQRKNKSASESLPFILQSLPPKSPFPPAPGFVKTILGPWVFYWKYAGLWKYTAYPWGSPAQL